MSDSPQMLLEQERLIREVTINSTIYTELKKCRCPNPAIERPAEGGMGSGTARDREDLSQSEACPTELVRRGLLRSRQACPELALSLRRELRRTLVEGRSEGSKHRGTIINVMDAARPSTNKESPIPDFERQERRGVE